MGNARITLPDGTVITITGTEGEIKRLLALYVPDVSSIKKLRKPGGALRASTKRGNTDLKRPTPTNLIRKLLKENFFKKPKSIETIKAKLKALGHILDSEVLSPPLLRLTRSGDLERENGRKGWEYKEGKRADDR